MRHNNITKDVALVVDLDRTLITADVAMESLVHLAMGSFRGLFTLLLCMFRGRAAMKRTLARMAPVDATKLPYRPEVLALIQEARRQGRKVILASAAHWRTANRVATHLGLFDLVIASRGRTNMKGKTKLAQIRAAIGDAAFDYVGDAPADRPIWQEARIAYTVGVSTGTAHEHRLFKGRTLTRALIKAARPHQWAKNALVFVPLATSGLMLNGLAIGQALIAFAFMSIIASSVYLLNDLVDIDSDRQHAKKCTRPLASGDLPIPVAVVAATVMMLGGLVGSYLLLSPLTFTAMACYCGLTMTYSFRLKSAMIADVLALACLYTIRIVAGAAAINVATSFWLLLFSVFFFLSLGYLKRYVELSSSARKDHELLSGRGYIRTDTAIVAISGIAAGMVSILVVVLFAEAMGQTMSYASPAMLWLLPLPLLYWLNRIWMMGGRGQVDSDPVAFAVTDPKSIAVGISIAAIVMLAKYAPVMGWMAAHNLV